MCASRCRNMPSQRHPLRALSPQPDHSCPVGRPSSGRRRRRRFSTTHASQLNRVSRREKVPKTAGNACRPGPGCRLGTKRTLAGLMDVDRDQLAMRDCEESDATIERAEKVENTEVHHELLAAGFALRLRSAGAVL